MINKNVAILYQVVDNTREVGFMPFEYVISTGLFDFDNYKQVGRIDIDANFLNNSDEDIGDILENIFQFGNSSESFYRQNPNARSISVSDIIKLYGSYYYVDSAGFEDITDEINNSSTKLNEDKEFDSENKEEITDIANSEKENVDIGDIEDSEGDFAIHHNEDDTDKTLLDYLQDRIGQQLSVGELNAVLQSLLSEYNKVFLMTSDLFNKDLDKTQKLEITDDEDIYTISYDIVDMNKGIIEITDVNMQ